MVKIIIFVLLALLLWIFGSQMLAWMIIGNKSNDDDHILDLWVAVFLLGILIFPIALTWTIHRLFIYPITKRPPSVDDIVP